MPLVERALQVLERREVQPQLGLLKSTMLQLDATFSEKAYGCGSFSDFVEKLKNAGYVNLSGSEGRYFIERKTTAEAARRRRPRPEEALPAAARRARDAPAGDGERLPGRPTGGVGPGGASRSSATAAYGFQEFAELLNFAQDKLLVRVEPDEEKGLLVYLGAEFYPPAPPEPEPEAEAAEVEEPQPIVKGQPSAFAEPEPPPKPRSTRRRKPAGQSAGEARKPRARRPPSRSRSMPPAE